MENELIALEKRGTELNAELKIVLSKIREIQLQKLLASSPFKVGDIVIHYDKKMKICRASLQYDKNLRFYGNLVKLDGTPGKTEFELYGHLTPYLEN